MSAEWPTIWMTASKRVCSVHLIAICLIESFGDGSAFKIIWSATSVSRLWKRLFFWGKNQNSLVFLSSSGFQTKHTLFIKAMDFIVWKPFCYSNWSPLISSPAISRIIFSFPFLNKATRMKTFINYFLRLILLRLFGTCHSQFRSAQQRSSRFSRSHVVWFRRKFSLQR